MMFNRRETLLLVLVFFVHFCLIVDFMIMMPLGAQLMRVFDMPAKQFSSLVTVYTFSAGCTGLIGAFFLDRFSRKSALIYSMLGFIAATFACSQAHDYSSLLIDRALTGGFVGLVGSIILSIVSDVIDFSRRGTAIGIVMAAFALASILGVPIGLFLSNKFTWSAAFIFNGAFSAIVLLLCVLKLPALDGHLKSHGRSIHQVFSHIRFLLNDRNRMLSLAFIATLILGHFSVIPFLFPSIVSNAKITESQLPVVYLFGGISSILATVVFGHLADRFGKKKVFAFALIASISALLLVTHLKVAPLYIVTLAVCFFFSVMGGRMAPATTLVTATVTPENRGSFMSLVSSTQHFAAALASFIAGTIVVKTDSGMLLGFENVGYLAVAFSLVSLFLIVRIQPLE